MKEIDNLLIFYPDRGLGDLLFAHTEKEIVSILGEPIERYITQYDINEYSINLIYENVYSIQAVVHYENNSFDRTDFFLLDLILDGVRFSDLTKKELMKYIKSYHLENRYNYKLKTEYWENVETEIYTFDSLGLMIWFEGEDLSDISNICVSKVIED